MENIDNFLEISDEVVSNKVIDSHLHLVDGFTKFPTFVCYFLENNKLNSINVSVQSIFLSNYDDMILQIKKMRISNPQEHFPILRTLLCCLPQDTQVVRRFYQTL